MIENSPNSSLSFKNNSNTTGPVSVNSPVIPFSQDKHETTNNGLNWGIGLTILFGGLAFAGGIRYCRYRKNQKLKNHHGFE